jgi:hypothetical protein
LEEYRRKSQEKFQQSEIWIMNILLTEPPISSL